MHAKKWNISILVIFVLLASSLLGVLAMNFVQSMMKQSATVYNYYQSYYLAKAGIELSLPELSHRGIWFEQSMSGLDILSGNFLCKEKCDMSFTLLGMSTVLGQQSVWISGCQSPFVLTEGSSLVVPLFRDRFSWSISAWFTSPIVYTNLYGALQHANLQSTSSAEVIFGMVVLSWEDLASDGIFFQTGDFPQWLSPFLDAFEQRFPTLLHISNLSNADISPYRFFFILSNPEDPPISFCLISQQALPMQQYLIKSQWRYNQQTLGLESVYRQAIPNFLLNGYLGFDVLGAIQ